MVLGAEAGTRPQPLLDTRGAVNPRRLGGLTLISTHHGLTLVKTHSVDVQELACPDDFSGDLSEKSRALGVHLVAIAINFEAAVENSSWSAPTPASRTISRASSSTSRPSPLGVAFRTAAKVMAAACSEEAQASRRWSIDARTAHRSGNRCGLAIELSCQRSDLQYSVRYAIQCGGASAVFGRRSRCRGVRSVCRTGISARCLREVTGGCRATFWSGHQELVGELVSVFVCEASLRPDVDDSADIGKLIPEVKVWRTTLNLPRRPKIMLLCTWFCQR
ncbi:Uncharacterised protein [Mycobacteroides abscessus subsp. massiliense]|nr:Uncharacterised protein [Mycobacteroides abscessus subsp. massiliense]SKU19147.1 Uncharacterised protein [Mycobacteroides abscessus subsp. massiliense]